MTKLLLLLLLLLAALPALAQDYAFPPSLYPTGPHPRLWLTQERLDTLQAARQRNTPEWQRFKASVDTYMDAGNESWAQWVGYAEAIPYTALMYRLTGDTAYVARTLYLARHAEQAYPDHEERYWIRNNGYLALGYDWAYDALSDAERAEYRAVILAYDDNLWNVAHYGGSRPTYTAIDTDRVSKGGSDHLLMGCAVHGDTPRSVDLLDRAWWTWTRGNGEADALHQSMRPSPIRRWVRDAAGGTYYTGLAYFMNTDTAGLSSWWTTLRTACNYDLNVQEAALRPFWRNVIRSLLDQIAPDRARLHNMGDWQDSERIAERNWYFKFLTLLAWEAGQAGDGDWAALARGLYDRTTSWHSDPFIELFFSHLPDDPARPRNDPWNAGLPTVRASQGVDMLYFRSGWGTDATWGVFSGQGGEPTDHQSEDTGAFALWRSGNYLTKTALGYRDFLDACYVHNTPSIDNGRPNGCPRLQAGAAKASMDRHRVGNTAPLFAYGMVNADGQWNLDAGEYSDDRSRDAPVTTYRRHLFWSGDHVVILDRLRAVRPVTFAYRLRSLSDTPPALDPATGTISQRSEDGSQRLLHRTLAPAGCTFTLVDEAAAYASLYSYQFRTDERKYQYRVAPAAATDTVNMLSVLQMGPASMTGMDTVQGISRNGSLGARLGEWAVVFADSENLRTSVSYTIDDAAAALQHLVCDLTPGRYLVRAGALAETVTVSDNDNTAHFTTPAGQGPLTVNLAPFPPAPAGIPLLLLDR